MISWIPVVLFVAASLLVLASWLGKLLGHVSQYYEVWNAEPVGRLEDSSSDKERNQS